MRPECTSCTITIPQVLARRYWLNEDPIGTQFKSNDPNSKSPWFTIVGVVGDIRPQGLEKSAETMASVPSSG